MRKLRHRVEVRRLDYTESEFKTSSMKCKLINRENIFLLQVCCKEMLVTWHSVGTVVLNCWSPSLSSLPFLHLLSPLPFRVNIMEWF